MRVRTVAHRPRGAVGDRVPARRTRARDRAARSGAAARGRRACSSDPVAEVAGSARRRGRAARPRARPGLRAQRPRLPLLHDRRAANWRSPATRLDGDRLARGDARARRHPGRPDPRQRPDRTSGPTTGSTSPPATPARATSPRTTDSLNGKFLRLEGRAVPRRRPGAPEIVSHGPPQPAGLRLAAGLGPPDLHRARPERRRRTAGLRRGQRIREGGNYGWPEVGRRAITATSTRR